MGLDIHRLSEGDGGDMGKAVIAAKRVYRTIDGRFVGEGDPDGAFLAYGIGSEIPPGDQGKYERFLTGDPQDALDSKSKAALAYEDEDVRDDLRRRQAGDPAYRTPLNTEPVLIHDRLATELADEAAAIANSGADAAVAEERSDPAAPGGVLAQWRVYRTAEGDLVHEGDEDAATLAYAVGQPISDGDVDEYNDLGAPLGADDAEPEETKTSAAGAKRATKSANKAAAKPADK